MDFKTAIIWLAGALFLIILAEYLPKVAIWVTALLLTSVLLINSGKYSKFFTTIQKGITG